MRLKVAGTALIALALTACSSQPREPAASTPVAEPPAAAGKLAPAVADGKAVPNRTLISAGYKPTTIKGEIYYCRTEDVTNTAFKKKVCLNESQLKDEEKRIKQMQEQILRSRSNPGCDGRGCG